jgi:hypothetical protein
MIDIGKAGTFALGTRTVKRLGYGAMQLAGKGVFGPPRDRASAIAVLRAAVESGVNHIDTSDFYGPHITNQITVRRCVPIAPIWSSSPRLVPGVARMARGFPRCRGRN